MLAAQGAGTELKGHVRGALNNGASLVELREVLLHSAVYASAPAAVEAFRAAREVLNELGSACRTTAPAEGMQYGKPHAPRRKRLASCAGHQAAG